MSPTTGVEIAARRARGSPTRTRNSLDLAHGTKDLLGHFRNPGPVGRFHSSTLVGIGCNDPSLHNQLVGGLSQQLVLNHRARCSRSW
jgi:hypothetical protein